MFKFSFVASFLLTLFSILGSTYSAPSDEVAWESFKTTFNKTYQNPTEEKYRKSIFFQNVRAIRQLNRNYGVKKLKFTCEVNTYADFTTDEFVEQLAGLRLNLQQDSTQVTTIEQSSSFLTEETTTTSTTTTKKSTNVPDSIDWRPTAVTPVKNQGKCGSCWTFSATGALEGQHAIKKKGKISFSEQNLIDCVRTNYSDGCNGGIMNDAFRYVRLNGIMSSADYPYEAVDKKTCRYDPKKKIGSCKGLVNIPLGSEEQLKKAVGTVGPVSAGFDATYTSIQFYSKGIYYEERCDPMKINHGILIVGYGTLDGQDYWLVKNSWGTTWGEKGYFKTRRNQNNHCGIATMASYPVL